MVRYFHPVGDRSCSDIYPPARLGNSGLKVSRIILGMMSYGSSDWQSWVRVAPIDQFVYIYDNILFQVLDEEEAMKHIKAAYDAGIQTFDTADVYSNGLSEVILGKAIKKFNLPRDEIVVMTKVLFPSVPFFLTLIFIPNSGGLPRDIKGSPRVWSSCSPSQIRSRWFWLR
jgi:aryl-alcohol dehydrogenase-like predicted oxidoreductase